MDIDPEYVMGHVGLGMMHLLLAHRRADLREVKHAQRALERAVELGPRHPVALGNLALLAGLHRDWARAVSLVRQMEPWTALADVGGVIRVYVCSLVNLDRWQEAQLALDELRRVLATAPNRYPHLKVDIAEATFWLRGDAHAAVEILGQDGRRYPPGAVLPPERDAPSGSPPVQLFVQTHPRTAFIYYYAGLEEDAVEVFLRGLSEQDSSVGRRDHAKGGWEGMLRGVLKSRRERGLLCPANGPSYGIPTADVLAALGEREAMYDCLEHQQAQYECYLEKDAERAPRMRAGLCVGNLCHTSLDRAALPGISQRTPVPGASGPLRRHRPSWAVRPAIARAGGQPDRLVSMHR